MSRASATAKMGRTTFALRQATPAGDLTMPNVLRRDDKAGYRFGSSSFIPS
jgi:hypothetical protein